MENESSVSTAEIENFLNRRLGEQEGAEIIAYIHSEIEKKTQERIAEVRTETELWRNSIKNEFYTKEDGEALSTKLIKRISAVEATIILWGFVFWVTALVGFYVIQKFII